MYTDKQTIENWLLKNIDSSFDAQIDNWIKAMSIYIDEYCKRNIYRDELETYTYDGDNTDITLIKDVCDITEVTLNGNDITLKVYKYPQNKHYTSRLVLDREKDGLFTKGFQNITVTGIQAMNKELPEDIKFACTVLVGGIVQRQILGIKKGSTERIGSYSISYKTDEQINDYEEAKLILNNYRRIQL